MWDKQTRTKGLTMIELVVAFALSAIFFTALLTVIAPVYRTYQRTQENADARLIAGNVIDTIRTTANTAQSISAPTPDTVQIGTRLTYSVNSAGHLQYAYADGESGEVYSPDYYEGKTIALSASGSNNVISLTVTVHTRQETTASVSGVISTLYRVLGPASTPGGGEAGYTPDPGGPSNPTPAPATTAGGGGNTTGNAVMEAELDRAHGILGTSLFSRSNPVMQYRYFHLGLIEGWFDHSRPDFNVHDVLSASMLNWLTAEYPDNIVYQGLASGEQFWADVYYTKPYEHNGETDPCIPIAYVTNTAEAAYADKTTLGSCPRGSAYLIYYDGVWYVPGASVDPANAMTQFNGKSDAQIKTELNANFVRVTSLYP